MVKTKRTLVLTVSVLWGAMLLCGQAAAPKQATPAATPAQSQAKKAAPVTAAPKPAAPKPSGELTPEEASSQVVQAHHTWGSDMNSSALFSASLQEVGRSGAVYTYHLYTVGLPRNVLYNIVAWPVNQPRPVEVVKGVALDATGMAICPGQLGTCGTSNAPNAPTNLSITIAPGRPVRVGLVSQDQTIGVYTKTVPMPIRSVVNGCTLEAVMLTPNGVIAVIEGSGFAPNAEINMQLMSGNQPTGGKTQVDGSGAFFAKIVPPINDGVNFGTMKVNVTSAKCSPALSFDWGTKPAPAAAAPAIPADKKQ
jgi:hypothetical protein